MGGTKQEGRKKGGKRKVPICVESGGFGECELLGGGEDDRASGREGEREKEEQQ